MSFRNHKYIKKLLYTTLFSFFIFFVFILGVLLESKYEIIEKIYSSIKPANKLNKISIISDPGLIQYKPTLNTKYISASKINDFIGWQEKLRKDLQNKLGLHDILTSNIHVEYVILDRAYLEDGIERLFFAYKSFDGSYIPAYLHIPATSGKQPAILVIPGHVPEGQSGIEQTSNEMDSYQHAAAKNLAKSGYITLTMELRGFGYLGEQFGVEHRIVAWNAILKGESYKQVELKDIAYAVKFLVNYDNVDSDRLGITGASYGGELSVLYAGLDENIKVTVFQSFGGNIGVKSAKLGSRKNQPHYCHLLPNLDSVIKQEEYFWLLSPRPTLGLRGNHDIHVEQESINTYASGWLTLNKSYNFRFKMIDGGHEFFNTETIAFFEQHLR
jgi:dienelactone hydrolase